MTPAEHYVDLFLRNIKARIATLQDDLLKGGASDFAAYRERIGELRGLRAALEMADEAMKKVRIGDDDE